VDWLARNDKLADLGFSSYDEYLASLAKKRDWRDERRLLKPNLVYREDVLNG
jgi:hypothetical protein